MEEANRTGSLIEIVYPEDTNSQGTLLEDTRSVSWIAWPSSWRRASHDSPS